MPNPTTNLGLTKPTPGDTSVWGTQLNADLDLIDAFAGTEVAARSAADTAEASARASAVSAEASTRATNDTTLGTAITTEASTRATADTTLQTNIDACEKTANKGVASGYASLDGAGKVPSAQLPAPGGGFHQVTLTFHDSDILNMQMDGSGGVVLLTGIAGKARIVLFCMLKFIYGGVAHFSGTAFDDLFVYQNQLNPLMFGSTKFLMDGAITPNFIQQLHHGAALGAILGPSVDGGDNVWLATVDTPLADGDPSGNTNSMIVTLGYLEYDIATGVVS